MNINIVNTIKGIMVSPVEKTDCYYKKNFGDFGLMVLYKTGRGGAYGINYVFPDLLILNPNLL